MRIFLVLFLLCSLFTNCSKKQTKGNESELDNVNGLNELLQKNELCDSVQVLCREKTLKISELGPILKSTFFKEKVKSEISRYFENESTTVYSVKLVDENISTSLKRDYIVLDLKKFSLQYIIPMEINQIFESDNKLVFGGVYNNREYDYYVIYKLDQTSVMRELDSRDIDGKTFVVGYYKDDECVDYVPNRLIFNYDKRKKEILFKGAINVYCRKGVDRTEGNKLVNTYKVELYFNNKDFMWKYDKERSNYFFW